MNHCTFHIMSVKVTSEHAADLLGYKIGRASIRFTPDEQLPAALITMLVKARIAENEAGRVIGIAIELGGAKPKEMNL